MRDTFGQRIRDLREQRGMSQYDVAEAILGRRDRAGEVSRWENDKNEPSHENLRKLAHFFTCSTDKLLGVASSAA
ncbi:helix-turn-helix domain-containing protein [Deinococcus sp. 12RED42]|uniref:helix-turn-helix domain-containing protein n=1 Tax=Deinococcus sp. 12RED42 TaxID=2745872 RepID=UPI00351D4293|nr:helix-turn-helix transcriptional regulator [Deinococcus sp. 12RED42]